MEERLKEANDMYERIDVWLDFHREDILEDIKRIVRIPSVFSEDGDGPFGKGCKDALEEMLQIGREHGFYVENYEHYLGSIGLEKKNFKNTIGLWNHLDVVPVGDNWQYDPFEATYIEPLLIGRGVSDNKGPAIGMLYIMQCLRELNVPLEHELCLFVGCNEERGMEDMAYYTSRYEAPAFSIVPDNSFPVCYGEKGIIEGEMVTKKRVSDHVKMFKGGTASNMIPDRASITLTGEEEYLKKLEEELAELKKEDIPFDYKYEEDAIAITYYGISKHSASPQGSSNAINGLCSVLYQLDCFENSDKELLTGIEKLTGEYMGKVAGIEYKDDISGDTTCAATIIDLREGRLYLTLNIRYAITSDNDKDLDALSAFAEEHDMEWKLDRNSKPNYFPKESPIVELLTGVYNETTRESRNSYVTGGGTYARKLPNALAYGLAGIKGSDEERELLKKYIMPGHGGAHEPDEVLNFNSYMKGLKIFARAIIALNKIKFLPFHRVQKSEMGVKF